QSEQFFKKYMRSWPYYISNDFKWQENNINSPKTIHFHGLPKNISQIKHVGSLLKDLHRDTGISDTALILGNEKLLPSLLNSIPKEIPKANITMGYELQNAPLNTFFQALFKLHLNRSKWNKEGSFYYRDLIAILNDPIIKSQWISHTKVEKGLREILYDDHVIFVSEDQLMRLIEDIEDLSELFKLIFLEWDSEVNLIIEKITKTIEYLKNVNEQYKLDQEYFYRYFNIFVQLSNLNKNFGFIDNLNTLYQIFQQLLKTEKLSFQGEPLEGLQIMGLLESRGLDFKNIIITSVNEGFLPASGSNNSFIPLDIKLEKKIPTFFEKDAIFSYHFFRLLHRAENVYLIYNSITDDFGSGEPSRFIRQLNAAKALGQLDKVQFRKKMISPKLNPSPLTLNKIIKTEKVMLKLSKLAEKGFSPSSLTNYIRNPLDFYKRSVLGIREFKEIEETIAANTFGTIVHDTLEQLYLPFINKTLQTKDVKLMIDLVDDEVTRQFKKSYSSKAITSGKNFLAFEIAKQFVINFLNFELSQLKQEKIIKILGLEVPVEIEHEVRGINMKVKLKGKIDRIDQVNGVYRIMDYKTGKVTKSQLKINEWELISSEERYNKSFQVLTYAYLYINKNNLTLEDLSLESGIISFKNLKDGFMPFNGSLINEEIISSFVLELDKLISEIFDVSIPFQEKELPVFYF
ncbi:MAG: PD-(D/E)XK nuclease family protein, partial [Flavobacteriales bacterium]|nr:PD-(D/E)XK nuclease family protein [Flavobacteriales bacterium]